jgi:hypothetical protein
MRSLRLLSATSILVLAFASGCSSAEESDTSEGELAGDARAIWADAKALNLDDLSRVAAKFASDGFNDALGGDIGALGGLLPTIVIEQLRRKVGKGLEPATPDAPST